MAYRDILVHVDNSKAARTRAAIAAEIARKFGSRLTGVFLKSAFVPAYVVGDGLVIPSENVEAYLAERSEETAKAMGAARLAFDEAVRDAGVTSQWLSISGDNAEAMIACARRHDLTVMGTDMRATFGQQVISATDIGMTSGAPVLVLKQSGFPAGIGRKVLIAWKDSRESARALRDAMPFLSQAEEVHLLTVSRDAPPELDDLMRRHLEQHDCKNIHYVVDRNDDMAVSDLIRRHAGAAGADLVVLGLYGHSRFREMVLGGVSRDLLADLPMPLLVSH